MFCKVTLILILLASLSSAWNYCEENGCSRPSEHIACNNPGGFGPKCKRQAHLFTLKRRLRNFIVNKINLYRDRVASGNVSGLRPAHRMASIQWDTELAKLAEYTVQKCDLKLDQCQNTKRFHHVGQLLEHVFFRSFRHKNRRLLAHQLAKWFKNTRSLAQLVQDRVTHVGCGLLRQHSNRRQWHEQVIACNFARGIKDNETAYEVGQRPGAGCQFGVHPQFSHLCALEEPQEKSKLRFNFSYSDNRRERF